jgi:hypothetical protein
MHWSSLVGEAWRNVRSGTALTVQLAVVVGLVTAAVIGFAGSDILAIVNQGAAYRASGANVLILQAPGAIDPAACEALNSAPGVRAGALRAAPHNLVAAVLPDSSVPTFEVSPGLASIIMAGRAREPEGVLVSRSVADTVGIEGAFVGTGAGADAVAVAGVYDYPRDGRRTDLEFAVLAPTASRAPFDECWAETWPESAQLESLLRSTRIPADSGSDGSTLLQWNGTHGAAFPGQALFGSRVTRWLPVAAALASLIIAFAAGRLRKVEFASARHSGVTLADQWVIVALESLCWVAAVFVVAVPVTCAFLARSPPGDAAAYVQLGATAPALASVGGLVGVTIAVALSGEKHLFRDVKGRR